MCHKILFPTDGSITAEAAGRFAAAIARGEGDEVLIFAVAEQEECEGGIDRVVEDSLEEYLGAVVEKEAAQFEKLGVSVCTEVVSALHVDEAIIDRANHFGVDMIVMGTHGRRGLARAVIGSVADRVVRQSHVPVVLVPPVAKAD